MIGPPDVGQGVWPEDVVPSPSVATLPFCAPSLAIQRGGKDSADAAGVL